MAKRFIEGRLPKNTKKIVEDFTESISFDKRLYRYDIQGSIAHTKMLIKQDIIGKSEGERIIAVLKDILKEIENSKFKFSTSLEDIHMNIENRLIDKIGNVGRKLHTARSRNDQIALDIRMYLRDEILDVKKGIRELQKAVLKIAEGNLDIIMPGYTHLQRAQPVLLSHHFMAYYEMLKRDFERFEDCTERVNIMPLGACALAGTSFNIDRNYVAQLLGFPKVSRNSIDTVGDRDFIIEFLCASAILMLHLSRLSEELILWSTKEFGFIELPDEFCTGSSIMPQKKNPDVLELIRGKVGSVYGDLISMFTIMKSLPLAYNRDMQEDKIHLFSSVDTIKKCLEIITQLIPQIKFNKEVMLNSAKNDYSLATDLADYLVKKGMPFRKAHKIIGSIVSYCIKNKKIFSELSLEEFKSYSRSFDEDVFNILTVESAIESRRTIGSTSKKEVLKQIRIAKEEVG